MATLHLSSGVYRLRNRTFILILAPLLFLLCLIKIIDAICCGQAWLTWLVALAVWAHLFVLALRRRLLLFQDGLKYTPFFKAIRVPWTHVTHLGSRRTLWLWRAEGLEAWTESPTASDLFIDLTQSSRSWRQESLGTILRARAPGLFAQSPPPHGAA